MSFLRRRLLTAALTANALRPAPGARASVPAFFAGWLTSELAPQLLTATLADTAAHAARAPRSRVGLALAGVTALGLAHLVRQAGGVRQGVEEALTEGIGADYADRLDPVPTPAELKTRWRSLVNPFRLLTPEVEVIRDIAYSDAGRHGRLDVYRSRTADLRRAPVLVQVHGGAWVIGDKKEQGLPLMAHLAAKGWVCVAINYRLAPRHPFPAHVIDVKRALAWVREHIADYGGDPDYVAITGGSAGGHLAALAALTPGDPAYQPGFEDADTSVQVAVPHYGVYDLAGATGLRSAIGLRDGFLAPRVMRTTWAEDPELFESASPLLRAGADAPDFFVLHGTHDTMVPVDQARMFVTRLREVSRRSVTYAELPGAQHAFDIFHSVRSGHVVRAVDRYLHWHWHGYRSGMTGPVPQDALP
ncbi:alpha/beta hydrolase fold domain-containing protein [Nocardioides donggukensis]|uniref:Alpha/beta hydrolase n=1 Tax=Nocardioides donggukensis TaxID=2774019 RepID=A0A927K392_9ACTN|nr:alpha/beta hydrolase [Nocardioides donggukensis]MBD8869574.1 alpha/beta hydrolase [Nocardioides donggukensis]